MTDLTDMQKRIHSGIAGPLWDKIGPEIANDDTFWDEVERELLTPEQLKKVNKDEPA